MCAISCQDHPPLHVRTVAAIKSPPRSRSVPSSAGLALPLVAQLNRKAVLEGLSPSAPSRASVRRALDEHRSDDLETTQLQDPQPEIDKINRSPAKPHLAIALGMVAHFMFQLVSRRYGHGSIILASNKSYGECGDIFADQVLAAAILDRLLHFSTTINIRGHSYRLR